MSRDSSFISSFLKLFAKAHPELQNNDNYDFSFLNIINSIINNELPPDSVSLSTIFLKYDKLMGLLYADLDFKDYKESISSLFQKFLIIHDQYGETLKEENQQFAAALNSKGPVSQFIQKNNSLKHRNDQLNAHVKELENEIEQLKTQLSLQEGIQQCNQMNDSSNQNAQCQNEIAKAQMIQNKCINKQQINDYFELIRREMQDPEK